ncbi:MAG TPA: hypothetical protein VF095_08850 [Bacillota bacterium]
MPRDMLPSFYQSIGNLLPATYGTNGYFSMIYGGGNLAADIKALLWITGMTLLIALLIVAIAYLRERKKTSGCPNEKCLKKINPLRLTMYQ